MILAAVVVYLRSEAIGTLLVIPGLHCPVNGKAANVAQSNAQFKIKQTIK